jgi:RNA polymerase sigma factor (sigma-70 family)
MDCITCDYRENFKDPFEQLDKNLCDWTEQIARRFIPEKEIREEIVQYTIVRVLPHRLRLYAWSETQLYGYLVRSVIFNHWRVVALGNRLSLAQDEEDTVLENFPDHDTADLVMVENDFLQALAELSSEQWTVYVKWKLEGWSYEQIAAHLGISQGAARTAYSRASKKINGFLLEQGYALGRIKLRG